MSNELENILPNDAQKQEGLHALSNDLFSTHEDSFEQEAQEGLHQIPSAKIAGIVDTLNSTLSKKLINNKKKKRTIIPSQQGSYIAIITILLLVVIAYIVIKIFMKR